MRMAAPPASIPEHWMMCKNNRRFWDAVDSTLDGMEGHGDSATSRFRSGEDGKIVRLETVVERADSTIADGEW